MRSIRPEYLAVLLQPRSDGNLCKPEYIGARDKLVYLVNFLQQVVLEASVMRPNSFIPVFLRVVHGFIFGRRRFCDVEGILYSVVSKYRIKIPSVLTLIRGIRKHSNIQWIKSRTSSFLFFISPGATLCPDRLFP